MASFSEEDVRLMLRAIRTMMQVLERQGFLAYYNANIKGRTLGPLSSQPLIEQTAIRRLLSLLKGPEVDDIDTKEYKAILTDIEPILREGLFSYRNFTIVGSNLIGEAVYVSIWRYASNEESDEFNKRLSEIAQNTAIQNKMFLKVYVIHPSDYDIGQRKVIKSLLSQDINNKSTSFNVFNYDQLTYNIMDHALNASIVRLPPSEGKRISLADQASLPPIPQTNIIVAMMGGVPGDVFVAKSLNAIESTASRPGLMQLDSVIISRITP